MVKIINSSNIEAVGYNKEERILKVQFKSGSVYEYLDVAEDHFIFIFDNKDDSDWSVGKYINQEIKSKFKVRQEVNRENLERALKKLALSLDQIEDSNLTWSLEKMFVEGKKFILDSLEKTFGLMIE